VAGGAPAPTGLHAGVTSPLEPYRRGVDGGDIEESDAGQAVGEGAGAMRAAAEYRGLLDQVAKHHSVMDQIAQHRSALDAAAKHHGVLDTMAQYRSALEAAGRSPSAFEAAARWQRELGGAAGVQRIVQDAAASLEAALRGSSGMTTIARLAQDLGGTETFSEMVRTSMGPTIELVAAHQQELARTAGLYQGLQQYAAIPPTTFAPAIETVTRMQSRRPDTGTATPRPEATNAPVPADQSVAATPGAEAPTRAPEGGAAELTQPGGTQDDFIPTLDAFIALGLAGKDLTVNTTAVAWLLTVRQVHRVSGRKAARQALIVFIYVAITVAGAAWMVNDDMTPSEATFIAAAVPLTVLVSVWNKLGGE